MKALLSMQPGGPETLVLGDLPEPVPMPGQLVVRVETCGVNLPDGLIIRDLYQGRFDRPFAPGGEIAGVVAAVGPGVEDLSPGDRVAAFSMIGGMAEYCTAPADACYRIGTEDDAGRAAQIPTIYATSWHGLVDRGRLRVGEKLLVLGAGSGVGRAAVDIASALGAHVVAAVSSQDKADAARAAGAHECLIYPQDMDARTASDWLKAGLRGTEVDIVYDPVGGVLSEAAFRSIAWGGRHLVIGFPGGIPKIALNLPLLKGADIVGVFMGAFAGREPARARANVASLFALLNERRIDPIVTRTFGLAEGAAAIALVEGRTITGKVVVESGR